MDIEQVVDITPEEAERFVTSFQSIYPDLLSLLFPPPRPKKGGTYFYCTTLVRRTVPKKDKLGRNTRYTHEVEVTCDRRFRRIKTYRRHWSRNHRHQP